MIEAAAVIPYAFGTLSLPRVESIVLGRSRETEPTDVLSVEVTLPVHDIATEFALLRSVLGARTQYEVGEPLAMIGVVFGPWSVGPSLAAGHQLVVTGPA